MRRNVAVAALFGGLVCTPTGALLWWGPGPALVLLGALLLALSIMIGWNA